MLENQKHLFQLPLDITYLNCAYQSPLMTHIEAIGQNAVSKKTLPHLYNTDDFFKPVGKLKKTFAQLIHCQDFERIAIIPSVSYGLASVAKNIQLKSHQNIIIASEQFPSNVYPWMSLTKDFGAELRIISPPDTTEKRGEKWNEKILDAIDENTCLVALGNIHWADGTIFDLMAIRNKTKEKNALLIIDGTQSVGVMPFDVNEIQPDALICVGYKWLMGPYAIGMAYYGEYFDNGKPIEESWFNREESDNFQNLVLYQENYRAKAFKYSMGEQSNFILVPMQIASLEQILEWGVSNIQTYCQNLLKNPLERLTEMGCLIEDSSYRAGHLFGIRLSKNMDMETVKQRLSQEKIYVSYRGDAVRISVHLYNDEADIQHLVDVFEEMA